MERWWINNVCGISLMAEHDLPKVEARVRFPYSAPRLYRQEFWPLIWWAKFLPVQSWSRWSDLNRRPIPYEGIALPAELHRQMIFRDCVAKLLRYNM